MYDLGLRIKELRTKMGWSQKDLAIKINKSVSAISSYELGVQQPPLDVVLSLAAALGVTVDYLTNFDKKKTYSVEGLSLKQQKIVELVFQELRNPTNSSPQLSNEQLEIFRLLIELFTH